MIRRLLRLVVLAGAGAWIVDRWQSGRAREAGLVRPAPIVSRVSIDAPIEAVWRVVADVEGQPGWMTDLRSVRLEPPGEVAVGARAVGLVRILGVSLPDPVTITELEPPERFAVRHDGLFRGDGVIVLAGGRDGRPTEVTWHETLVAPILPWAWSLASGPVLVRVFAADLQRLRAQVEAAGAA